jgi:hypothetical protein
VVTDPTSNLQKYSEIKTNLANLQNKINTSKLQGAVLGEHDKFRLANPSFNTEENKKRILEYRNTPMSKRKNFMLETPVSINPSKVADFAMASTKRITDVTKLDKTKHYFINEKGESYDPDEYVANYKNIMSTMTDPYGRTELDNMRTLYGKSKTVNADGTYESFDDFVKHSAMGFLHKDTKSSTMTANPVAENNDRIAMQKYEADQRNALGWANLAVEKQANLDRQNMVKSGQFNPELAAQTKAAAIYNAFTGKGIAPSYLQSAFGSDPSQDIQLSGGSLIPMEKKDENGQTILKADGTPEYEMVPSTKQKIPRQQIIDAKPNKDGGMELTVRENQLDADGKPVHTDTKKNVTFEQFENGLNNMNGMKFTPQMQSGSAAFNQKVFGKENPTWEDYMKHFNKDKGKGGAGSSSTVPNAKDPAGLF